MGLNSGFQTAVTWASISKWNFVLRLSLVSKLQYISRTDRKDIVTHCPVVQTWYSCSLVNNANLRHATCPHWVTTTNPFQADPSQRRATAPWHQQNSGNHITCTRKNDETVNSGNWVTVLNLINRQYLPVQAKQSVTKVATGTILQLSYTSAVPATGRKRTEKNCKNAETVNWTNAGRGDESAAC